LTTGRPRRACTSASDVIAFLQVLIPKKVPFRDKTPAPHLRNFFRYLFKCGLTSSNLALCMPSVARRYDARLPRYLTPDQCRDDDDPAVSA
jgi:integrase/recombinase XerD